MRPAIGILEGVGLVLTLAFAVPVGVAGAGLVLDGRTALGATLLVVAVLMVVVPRRVVAPQDLPGMVVERAVGRAVKDPDGSEGGDEKRDEGGADREGGDGGEGRKSEGS